MRCTQTDHKDKARVLRATHGLITVEDETPKTERQTERETRRQRDGQRDTDTERYRETHQRRRRVSLMMRSARFVCTAALGSLYSPQVHNETRVRYKRQI